MPRLNLIIVKKPVSLHLTKMRSKTCYNNSSQTIPSNSYEQTQFKTNQKNINVIHKQITDMQDQKMQHQMSGTENAGPEFVRPNVTHARTHARTHTHTHNCLTAICLGLPGCAGTRRNIHPLTHIRKKKDSHRQQVHCMEAHPLYSALSQ